MQYAKSQEDFVKIDAEINHLVNRVEEDKDRIKNNEALLRTFKEEEKAYEAEIAKEAAAAAAKAEKDW
jgi:uncharacterized protein YaaN involved in tellurite resistance